MVVASGPCQGQAWLLTPVRVQEKMQLVRMTLLRDPGEPGAKDIYVLPHERELISPMAENISSSVQTPGL